MCGSVLMALNDICGVKTSYPIWMPKVTSTRSSNRPDCPSTTRWRGTRSNMVGDLRTSYGRFAKNNSMLRGPTRIGMPFNSYSSREPGSYTERGETRLVSSLGNESSNCVNTQSVVGRKSRSWRTNARVARNWMAQSSRLPMRSRLLDCLCEIAQLREEVRNAAGANADIQQCHRKMARDDRLRILRIKQIPRHLRRLWDRYEIAVHCAMVPKAGFEGTYLDLWRMFPNRA